MIFNNAPCYRVGNRITIPCYCVAKRYNDTFLSSTSQMRPTTKGNLMLKHLIAGIAAASMTFATPTYAGGLDRDDVGKLVIGLAAIAALSAATNNRSDNNDRRSAPAVTARNSNNWSNLNRQATRRAIPSACLHRVQTRLGTQRLFGQRCLERNYNFVNSLPNRCAVRVFTSNGPRRGFDPVCLREQGFRSDRRN